MAFNPGAPVGLDIGTSAVRAAQVTGGRSGASLAAFAQVPLPQGAVSDGEIRDPEVVCAAISQLWKRMKVRNKRAVVGIANQRVVVRQVDLPYQEEKEFRSTLRFQVADHIPMPVDSAELDFQILEDYTADSGERMMRVLLIAAATDMVEAFISTASGAGVQPTAIDLAPFAAARAVSASARGDEGAAGSEAVVDIGAGITNILVHSSGEPRFVRILLVGGNDATEALASELDIDMDEAEAVKLDLGRGVGTEEGQRILADRVGDLVNEIRSSIEYHLSQEDSEPVANVLVTGGGSLTPGLVEGLQHALNIPVARSAPMSEMSTSKSGLTQEQIAQVEPVAAVAIGLALGAAR